MRRFFLPATLGLAHGVADGTVGLLLASLPQTTSLSRIGMLVLLFHILALGAQPVVGLLTDRLQRPRLAALTGLSLLSLALLVAFWRLDLAIALAGLGSAAFHVGGGALALCHSQGRATDPGLFAAPGIAGLALGGVIAVTYGFIIWPFLLLLVLLGVAINWLNLLPLPYQKGEPDSEPLFEGHDLVMLTLLAAIALRSAVWNTFQLVLEGNFSVLLALGIAAALGKIAGGFLADWLGWRRWAVGALLAAAPLLAFGGQYLGTLLLGVALLQSATPVTLAAVARLTPRQPATAIGLAIGLALALGGIPTVTGLTSIMASPPMLFFVVTAAATILWWALRRQQKFSAYGGT